MLGGAVIEVTDFADERAHELRASRRGPARAPGPAQRFQFNCRIAVNAGKALYITQEREAL